MGVLGQGGSAPPQRPPGAEGGAAHLRAEARQLSSGTASGLGPMKAGVVGARLVGMVGLI